MRSNRVFFFNTPIHIMNRLNPELKLRTKDLDGIIKILKKAKYRFKNVRIMNYSVGLTHFHIEAVFLDMDGGVSMSKFMQWVGTVIAQYINKVLNRHGRVFIDRYKSKIINTLKYLSNVSKYVMYNICKHMEGVDIEEWKWSSYRYYKYGERDELVSDYRDVMKVLLY